VGAFGVLGRIGLKPDLQGLGGIQDMARVGRASARRVFANLSKMRIAGTTPQGGRAHLIHPGQAVHAAYNYINLYDNFVDVVEVAQPIDAPGKDVPAGPGCG